MSNEKPVLEFHEHSGRVYRVWANGRTEGFEEGFV